MSDKRASIVSFYVPPDVKKELQRTPNYTVKLRHLVLENMGICPLCSHKWDKNKVAARPPKPRTAKAS